MLKKLLNFYHSYMATIPIFISEPRGPLDYFIWSDSLFGISNNLPHTRVRFDENSVLMFDYGDSIGVRYNPAYIGWWGLLNLRRYLVIGEKIGLENFRRQVEWFLKNQKRDREKSAIWRYEFDWNEGKTVLRAPWISSMSQGLAISCLIRAYRLNPDDRLLETSFRASKAFELEIKDGGVRATENGIVFYEEYAAFPIVRIFDGFVFGLLGLYDLYEETKDNHIKRLFDDGVEGVRSYLRKWNYRNIWSFYGNHGFLSPPEYNKLNAVLMGVLFKLTHDSTFEVVWKSWDNENRGYFRKMKTLSLLFLRNIFSRRVIP
jgi:hypothetical protein